MRLCRSKICLFRRSPPPAPIGAGVNQNAPLGCIRHVGVKKNYEQLFGRLDKREPPAGLLERIMLRIAEERRRRVQMRTAVFGVLSLVALAALVPAWRELNSEITQSGFSQFASLIFSDGAALAAYWQDFAFSLLESLPVFGMVAVLGVLLALFSSLKFFVQDAGMVFRRTSLAKIN